MLNRRILRIKAMQALYGFYTTRESLVLVVRDDLKSTFTPVALTHDMSDTEEIDQNRIQALKLYDENLTSRELKPSTDISDGVFDEVSKAIDSYYAQVSSELKRVKKLMISDTHNIQNVYYKFLLLPSEFQHIEKLDKDKKEVAHIASKEVWNNHFLSNPIIEAITTLPALQRAVTDKKISWQGDFSLLKSWYQNTIKKDEGIIAYQQKESPTIEEHKEVLIYLFKKLIFKNADMIGQWEQENLRWAEDGIIIKSMIIKTIQEHATDQEDPIELKAISLNEEEDFEFFETIYDATIKEDEYLEELIGLKAKNWDISRLAVTDRVILKMALAEMMHCRSIPVKVTINEYIEVCKQYSTPKSKQFVNGILDVLANQLTSEGVIKKTGRGLIDNK